MDIKSILSNKDDNIGGQKNYNLKVQLFPSFCIRVLPKGDDPSGKSRSSFILFF